ncbi:hypothetical protein ACFYKX_21400 [Cytobacillus sp. FJAT-54145]|uniref:Uncharacterized protein n=1 Tax=Cytobacillus spartinae TaxID=3299023 RepID=A0ABW6KG42_9BACI
MEIRLKPFLIILGVLLLSWAGSYLYYDYTKLEKPLFFKHYYDLSMDEDGYFQLYYAKDQYDDRRVISISFPEEPEVMMSVEEGHPYDVGKYKVQELFVKFHYPEFDREKVIHTNTLIVSYSDGFQETVDIGDLYITKFSNPDKRYIEFIAGGSGGNQDFYTVQAVEDFTLQTLSHAFERITNEHLVIEIDTDQTSIEKMDQRKKENQNRDINTDETFAVGKPGTLPMDIKQGDYLKIVSHFKKTNIAGYYLSFPLTARVNQDGKTSEMETSLIRYQPSWEQGTLKNYIKEMRDKE